MLHITHTFWLGVPKETEADSITKTYIYSCRMYSVMTLVLHIFSFNRITKASSIANRFVITLLEYYTRYSIDERKLETGRQKLLDLLLAKKALETWNALAVNVTFSLHWSNRS